MHGQNHIKFGIFILRNWEIPGWLPRESVIRAARRPVLEVVQAEWHSLLGSPLNAEVCGTGYDV